MARAVITYMVIPTRRYSSREMVCAFVASHLKMLLGLAIEKSPWHHGPYMGCHVTVSIHLNCLESEGF